jgi:hypothetical protein
MRDPEIVLFHIGRVRGGRYAYTKHTEIRSFSEWGRIQDFLASRVGQEWLIVVY